MEQSASASLEKTNGRRQTIDYLLPVLLWGTAGFNFAYWAVFRALESPAVDYYKHWEAARALLYGDSPYVGGRDLYLGFNYPLFTGYIFLFHGLVSAETGRTIWQISNALFALAGATVAALYMKPDSAAVHVINPKARTEQYRALLRRYWAAVCFCVVFSFQPLLHCFPPGNLDAFNFVLFVCFAAALVRQRDAIAGVLLTMLTLVKLAPIVLVVPLFAIRRFRILAWSAGCLAAYALLLIVTGLWRYESFLYTDVLPKIGYHYLGISFSTQKLLAQWLNPGALHSEAAYNAWVLRINLALLSILAGVCGYWRRVVRRNSHHVIAFTTIMVVLMSPLLEYHHLVWMAPALFIHLRDWVTGRVTDVQAFLLAIGWFAVIMVRVFNDFTLWDSVGLGYTYMPVACAYLAIVSASIALQREKHIELQSAPYGP